MAVELPYWNQQLFFGYLVENVFFVNLALSAWGLSLFRNWKMQCSRRCYTIFASHPLFLKLDHWMCVYTYYIYIGFCSTISWRIKFLIICRMCRILFSIFFESTTWPCVTISVPKFTLFSVQNLRSIIPFGHWRILVCALNTILPKSWIVFYPLHPRKLTWLAGKLTLLKGDTSSFMVLFPLSSLFFGGVYIYIYYAFICLMPPPHSTFFFQHS